MNRLKLLALCFTLWSGSCIAGGYLTPLGTGVGISKYMVLDNGTVMIWLAEAIPQNPDSCTQTTKVVIEASSTLFELKASSIIAAHAQGRTVGFWSSGCAGNSFWGGGHTFPVVRDLWVN